MAHTLGNSGVCLLPYSRPRPPRSRGSFFQHEHCGAVLPFSDPKSPSALGVPSLAGGPVLHLQRRLCGHLPGSVLFLVWMNLGLFTGSSCAQEAQVHPTGSCLLPCSMDRLGEGAAEKWGDPQSLPLSPEVGASAAGAGSLTVTLESCSSSVCCKHLVPRSLGASWSAEGVSFQCLGGPWQVLAPECPHAAGSIGLRLHSGVARGREQLRILHWASSDIMCQGSAIYGSPSTSSL